MRFAIGSDHAGFRHKRAIAEMLRARGDDVADFGTDSEEPTDYPRHVRPVARAVASGEVERGIVLGGSGNGEAMVANRERGVRCALCWSVESASLARRHNDANVLSLGARLVPLDLALEVVRTWVETPFEGGRHARRVADIDEPAPGEGAAREILALEEALARRDEDALPGGFAGVVDADFVEFGSSGRAWDRAAILEALATDGGGAMTVHDLTVRGLGGDVVLATFRTTETSPGVAPRRRVRSSIWRRRGASWTILFHQATPVG
jgi:ribose 5-phosphate isomerase B